MKFFSYMIQNRLPFRFKPWMCKGRLTKSKSLRWIRVQQQLIHSNWWKSYKKVKVKQELECKQMPGLVLWKQQSLLTRKVTRLCCRSRLDMGSSHDAYWRDSQNGSPCCVGCTWIDSFEVIPLIVRYNATVHEMPCFLLLFRSLPKCWTIQDEVEKCLGENPCLQNRSIRHHIKVLWQ